MVIIWTVVTAVLFVIEIITTNLVTIWIAIGAVAAAFAALAGIDVIWQRVIFIFLSALLLIVTKPLLKKFVRKVPTNADALIGKTAVVTEKIEPVLAKGQVKAGAAIWSARSENETVIEKDEIVKVVRIEGVKLIVKKESEE